MPYSLINLCARILLDNKLTIAIAECSTGGKITSNFSTVVDSAQFLKGGIVCYSSSNFYDPKLVSNELLENFSIDSPEIAESITQGLSKIIDADIHIGITGHTNEVSNAHSPLGTMYMHATFHGTHLFSKRYSFQGETNTIITQTSMQLAYQLRDSLISLYEKKQYAISG